MFEAANALISRLTGRAPEKIQPTLFSQRLSSALASLDHVTDRLGHEIDPGIREPVAALLALGHGTAQSCEGHPMEGPSKKAWATGGPYIDVFRLELASSENERMKIAKETNQWPSVSPENKRIGLVHKMEIDGLLDEFYLDRSVDTSAKLVANSWNGGTYTRIESRGVALQEFNRENPTAWNSSLKSFQMEMQDFGGFLLDKGYDLDAKNKLSAPKPR